MRLTTQQRPSPPAIALAIALLSTLLAGACVGGLEDGKRPGRGSGSDSDPEDPSAACKWIDAMDPLNVVSSSADFAALGAPTTGCWDFNGNLRLESSAITSLDKLGDLRSVNDLEIIDTGLTTINTKSQLKVWGSLVVSGNNQLTSLANLSVRKWTGAVEGGGDWLVEYAVRDNAALTNLDGLKYISAVDGELEIAHNPKLASATFSDLRSADGGVRITNNGLVSLDLGKLESVGRLEIASNVQLASFTAPRASSIDGDLVLRGNTALTAIGASSSTQINGALTIDNNDALVDLGALSSLRYVTSTIAVTNNQRLANLGPIARLDGAGSTITITDNPALSICRAIEVDGCVQSGAVIIQGNLNETTCTCWCANTARHTTHQ